MDILDSSDCDTVIGEHIATVDVHCVWVCVCLIATILYDTQVHWCKKHNEQRNAFFVCVSELSKVYFLYHTL